MYNFNKKISLSYEFSVCVTHEDGHKTTYCKVEHIDAQKDNTGFLFTLNGSSEETINGKEPEDWGEIYLKFEKAKYPYSLQTTAEGKLIAVKNFDEFKERWMEQRSKLVEYYEYNQYVKEVSYNYMYTLTSERMFISILNRNSFFNFLFWQDSLLNHEVEIQDFPTPEMLSIFCFHGKGIKDGDTLIYKTDKVYDEGNGYLLGGNCTIIIRRDADGLPEEVTLSANVERDNYGFFNKEMKLKRL